MRRLRRLMNAGATCGKSASESTSSSLFASALEFLAVLGQLRLKKVGGAAGDDILGLDARLGAHLVADLAGQLAVFAAQHGLGFLGNHLIALAGDDVQHGLRADDLARGRDQRGIAEVLAHARDLSEHVVILVLLPGLLELGDEI